VRPTLAELISSQILVAGACNHLDLLLSMSVLIDRQLQDQLSSYETVRF
jgi:hypothetical protein